MNRSLVTLFLAFAFSVLLVCHVFAQEKAATQATKPTEGWSLHVDAKRHIPKMPDMILHHYCKPVSGGSLNVSFMIATSRTPDLLE